MMPCLARCRTGRHTCTFAHGHPGAHAAPGHIWDTPSPTVKRAEVCELEGDWTVFECAEKPSTRYPIGERAAGIEHPDSPFRSYQEALDAALAWVGLSRDQS